MTLDLTKVAPQVEGMVGRLKTEREERGKRLETALDTLGRSAADLDALRKKIASSKTSWLVAGLVGGLDGHYVPPPLPPDFTVIATDGSHIEVDRHRAARCYLINIGSVGLRYGAEPDAALESTPRLYASPEDLAISPPPGTPGREQPIEGPLLGARRSVQECRRLAELAREVSPGMPAVALLDGSLILWGLDPYPDFVTGALLEGGLLPALEGMRKLSADRPLGVASYISFPRSTDVVNALRVALCPHAVPNCDHYCLTNREPACDEVAGVQDRELFSRLLGPGERSAVFLNQSSVVKEHYGEHRVHFFYMRAEDEIARVELPGWVAKDESLLALTHSLVLDQCRRGQGYPVALSEAHEQAVVTGADRENFWQLVETSLVDEHLPALTSAKSQSKRGRWV